MRLRGIRDVEAANTFLRRECVTEFNRRFSVPAAEKGGGFVKCPRKDLDWVFSIQRKRRVNSDHSVVLDNRMFQTENNKWSRTLAGSTFVVHELRHGTVAIRYGPHEVARFAAAERSGPRFLDSPVRWIGGMENGDK